MNTIDVTSKWIVKMFKFNSRETDGSGCQFYENGIQGNLVGIQSSEFVFGIAQIDNTTYYFTEGALMVNGPHLKIGWNEVSTISGSFRSSHKIIHIETLNRIKVALPIAKFPYRIQQLIYQLIERHSSNNLLPRFLGPKAVRQTFEIADTAFCNKVGLSLNRFEIAFRIPLGENSGILLYQGDFNSAESFIYPAIGKDFVVGWWHKNQWIPLLAAEKQHQKAYDNAELEELLRSGFRRLPIDISEVICHYIYSEIEEENAKDNDIIESFEVNDPNENYTSVGIYYFEQGQLKELTECEIA